MVHKTPWKIIKEEERPCPEEARGPRLEPGPDGGLVGERLVAGFATEPGRAQPEEATWHPPLFVLWAHHLQEDPLGSGALPHGWR